MNQKEACVIIILLLTCVGEGDYKVSSLIHMYLFNNFKSMYIGKFFFVTLRKHNEGISKIKPIHTPPPPFPFLQRGAEGWGVGWPSPKHSDLRF